jgi:hypothetical protein
MSKLFSLSKWRLPHLLFAWAAYWLGVTAVKLGPAIAALLVATREPGNNTSSASLNWGTAEGITASILHHGETLWSGATSFSGLIGWVALPPLALWLIWLRVSATQRSVGMEPALLDAAGPPAAPVRTPVPLEERR